MKTTKTLIDTNPYLANPRARERMLRHSVLQSSYFEGARGIRLGRKPRRKQSPKNAAKGS